LTFRLPAAAHAEAGRSWSPTSARPPARSWRGTARRRSTRRICPRHCVCKEIWALADRPPPRGLPRRAAHPGDAPRRTGRRGDWPGGGHGGRGHRAGRRPPRDRRRTGPVPLGQRRPPV